MREEEERKRREVAAPVDKCFRLRYVRLSLSRTLQIIAFFI